MQKRTLVAWFSHCLLLIVPLIAFGQTYVNGEVYGVWDVSSSPYYVTDEITVEEMESLTIYEGVEVYFLGLDALTVKGTLRILGQPGDSVYFNSDPHDADDPNWTGLVFTNTAGLESEIGYASIHNCATGVRADTIAPRIYNSLINADNIGLNIDGAILEITDTDFVIENCSSALRLRSPHATITRCTVHAFNPSITWASYGIYSEHSNFDDDFDTFIEMRESNIFVYSEGMAIGVFLMSLDHSIFQRNIIYASGKSSTTGLKIVNTDSIPRHWFDHQTIVIESASTIDKAVIVESVGRPSITNSIIYADGPSFGIYADLGAQPNVQYCDVANVDYPYVNFLEGDGCIEEDPLFKNFYEKNFHITEGSLCIDAGSPDSPLDPDGTRADIGRFYYMQVGVEPGPARVISAELISAYPNPFNAEVKIELVLPYQTQGGFAIYNQAGQRVHLLQSGNFMPGSYRFNWKAEMVSSGIYWAVFESKNQKLVQPLILIK
ncbi:T9SS type A sorting domain-containing protein [bacterium]|nr:T9SS type A sorting domain-containing protein [bacterium]